MGLADDLENLKQVHRSGVLSDSEYSRAQVELLVDGVSEHSALTRLSARSRRLLAYAAAVVLLAGGVTVALALGDADPDTAQYVQIDETQPTPEPCPMPRDCGTVPAEQPENAGGP